MNTTTSALTGGAFVILGHWSRGKDLNAGIIIDVLFLAVMLALLNQINPSLAQKFGVLYLIVAVVGNAQYVLPKIAGKK